MSCCRFALIIIGPVLIIPNLAHGFYSNDSSEQDLLYWFNYSGSLRGAYWSGSRKLDDEKDIALGAVWLEAQPSLGQVGDVRLDAWYMADTSSGGNTKGLVRELFFTTSYGNLDISAGRKMLIWGRADRLNPTDNITPRDYTLLVPNDTDQRFGTSLVKADYYLDTLSLTAIWLLEFKPNIVPIASRPGVVFTKEDESNRRSWAVKVEQSGDAVDWSLSYLDGYNLNADIHIAEISPSEIVLALRYLPVKVIGADLATTVGRYGVRAELAYTRTEDPEGVNPFISNPYIYIVAGGDRTFYDYLNLNMQMFFRQVSNYENPDDISDVLINRVAHLQAIASNQLDPKTYGLTMRVSNKWFNATLDAELALIFSLPRHDYLVRMKSTYAFTDQWAGTVGGDIFRGPVDSFYGSLRKNSVAFMELRYAF